MGLKLLVVLVFIAVGWQFIKPENFTPYMIPDDMANILNPKYVPDLVKNPTEIGKYLTDYGSWNHHGYGGILGGASIVFFAFIGFDAVSTTAQEAKNPGRDMPIGILGSLALCTVLYILFGHVLTGVANWTELVTAGKEASVAYAIKEHMTGYGWLATAVTCAILAGFSSVILAYISNKLP